MIKKNPIKSFTGDGRECTPESRIVKIGLEFWNRIRNVHHLFPRLCCCGRSRILHRPCVRQTKPGLQTGRLAHSPTAVRERALHQILPRGGFLSQGQIFVGFRTHLRWQRRLFSKNLQWQTWGFLMSATSRVAHLREGNYLSPLIGLFSLLPNFSKVHPSPIWKVLILCASGHLVWLPGSFIVVKVKPFFKIFPHDSNTGLSVCCDFIKKWKSEDMCITRGPFLEFWEASQIPGWFFCQHCDTFFKWWYKWNIFTVECRLVLLFLNRRLQCLHIFIIGAL